MKLPINNRTQSGMVLVITVIMLSVITLMAVAYIAFARRERVSVVMSVTRTEAHLNLDQALSEAGKKLEEALQGFRIPGVLVSTNHPPTNSFYDPASLPLLTNYSIPPVTYDNDNDDIADEFRFYLDLNRDEKFIGTQRYYLILGRRTWQQAKQDAQFYGGHLATFAPGEPAKLPPSIKNYLSSGRLLWIGGYQAVGAATAEPKGGWNWITGGVKHHIPTMNDVAPLLPDALWAPGQPDNAGAVGGVANHACAVYTGGNIRLLDEPFNSANVSGYILEYENTQAGDPHWIGQLENPDSGVTHSKENRFVSRLAYMALPAGLAMDFNTAHNDDKHVLPTSDFGFWRGHEFPGLGGPPEPKLTGAWDLNLAATLNVLNPNLWQYDYRPNFGVASRLSAFFHAKQIFDYRDQIRPHRDLLDFFNTQNPRYSDYRNFATQISDPTNSSPLSFYQLAGSVGAIPRTGPVDQISLHELRSHLHTEYDSHLIRLDARRLPDGRVPLSDLVNYSTLTLNAPNAPTPSTTNYHNLYNGAQADFLIAPSTSTITPLYAISDIKLPRFRGYRGPWAAGVRYLAGDMVRNAVYWICKSGFTSGSSFNGAKWARLYNDISTIDPLFVEIEDASRIRLFWDRDPQNPARRSLDDSKLLQFCVPFWNSATETSLVGLPTGVTYLLKQDKVLNTFERIADRFLRDSDRGGGRDGIRRLKVYGSDGLYPWDYDAETHRLLQVAANITDCYSPGFPPSVFHPVWKRYIDLLTGNEFLTINRFRRDGSLARMSGPTFDLTKADPPQAAIPAVNHSEWALHPRNRRTWDPRGLYDVGDIVNTGPLSWFMCKRDVDVPYSTRPPARRPDFIPAAGIYWTALRMIAPNHRLLSREITPRPWQPRQDYKIGEYVTTTNTSATPPTILTRKSLYNHRSGASFIDDHWSAGRISDSSGFPIVMGVKNRRQGSFPAGPQRQIYPNLNEVALEFFVWDKQIPGVTPPRFIKEIYRRVSVEVFNSTRLYITSDIKAMGETELVYKYNLGASTISSAPQIHPFSLSRAREVMGGRAFHYMYTPFELVGMIPNIPRGISLEIIPKFRVHFELSNNLTGRLIDHANLILNPIGPVNVPGSTPLNPHNMRVELNWQVNDPLVNDLDGHYTPAQGTPQPIWPWRAGSNYVLRQLIFWSGKHYKCIRAHRSGSSFSIGTAAVPYWRELNGGAGMGAHNDSYQPWDWSTDDDLDLQNVARKDPGVKSAFDWKFPNQWPTAIPAFTEPPLGVGQLGRIHRGTPWQTLYLKSQTYSGRVSVINRRMVPDGRLPRPGFPVSTVPVYRVSGVHSFRNGDAVILKGSAEYEIRFPGVLGLNYVRIYDRSTGEFSLHRDKSSLEEAWIHLPTDIPFLPLTSGGWLTLESPAAWQRWAGYPQTQGPNDWRLFDHFTSLQIAQPWKSHYRYVPGQMVDLPGLGWHECLNAHTSGEIGPFDVTYSWMRPGAPIGTQSIRNPEKATHGLLSVNQTHYAAWASVMSGIKITTDTGFHYTTPSENHMRDIVGAINDYRTRTRGQQPFERPSDILAVPMLTEYSPYVSSRATDRVEHDYEAIPSQILPLLRASRNEDPYAVLYGFSQTLKPADNSIQVGTGVVTNYVITGEQAGRAVAWIENRPRERWRPNRWYRPGDVVWDGGTNIYRCAYNKELKQNFNNSPSASVGSLWEEVPWLRGGVADWAPLREYHPGEVVEINRRKFVCLRKHQNETIPPQRQPWLWQESYTGLVKNWSPPARRLRQSRSIILPSGGAAQAYSTDAPAPKTYSHPFTTGDIVRLSADPGFSLGLLAGRSLKIDASYGTQEFSFRDPVTNVLIPPVPYLHPATGLPAVTVTLIPHSPAFPRGRTIRYVKGQHAIFQDRLYRCLKDHSLDPALFVPGTPDHSMPANVAIWVPERVRLKTDSFEPLAIRQPK